MSYTYIGTTSGGDTSATCVPEVYILKTVSGTSSDRTTAKSSLDDTLSDALSSGHISGYKIYEYDTDMCIDPNGSDSICGKDDNDQTVMSQITSWRQDNGFTSSGNYIAVNRRDTAFPGATGGGIAAWDEPVNTQVSFIKGNPPVSTSHEMLHAFIYGKCDEVNKYISRTDSNGNPIEHDLGSTIDVNGDMLHTPFGGGPPSENGACSVSDASVGTGRTLQIPSCTGWSLHYTAEHVFTSHRDFQTEIC